jgi:two-component sensor histidine kinase
MLEALEVETAIATAPLTLVQEISETQQTGVVIYLPLRGTSDPELEGFAYVPLRMGDLFTAALRDDLPIEIRAVDADAPGPALFETQGYLAKEAYGSLSSHAEVSVAGRDWILSAQATPAFDVAEPLRRTALTAFVFALLVLSTAAAVHWQGMAIRRSRTLNEAVQRNVEQKDWLLREMAHRLKNALTRVSAITRQTAREAASKEEMVTRLNARLQAMSAAQDLLMLSGTDSADLEELLRSEIDQISGSASSPGRLSGPPVRLDERQTHALALVFHELATNALKYGAGAQAGGDLRIAWTLEPGTTGDELQLTWEERTLGPAAAAPGPGSGFGTRLLDAMVTGELGGSVLRETQEGRLRIEIRFPVVTASGARAV